MPRYRTNDLTVLYLTLNRVPEPFASWQRQVLLEAIGRAKLLSFSAEPMDFGDNYLQGEPGLDNLYLQMLRGATMAKTKFVAIAEDDWLYPAEHFTSFRPGSTEFAYDLCRWSLDTWSPTPIFSWTARLVNACLIAPRDLMVKNLNERVAQWQSGRAVSIAGELGRYHIERHMGMRPYLNATYWSLIPSVHLRHLACFGANDPRGKNTRPGPLRAIEVPRWGTVSSLVSRFRGEF